jgi:DNA-binding HxlR family transcriptional regulator
MRLATWDDLVVSRHGQYCPVTLAADVLADRWTLLILRELLGGATRFNEIERCLPKVSRSVLSQRLRQMQRVGLIDTIPLEGGRGYTYQLTAAGKDLEPVLTAMGEWAIRWIVEEPRDEDLDATFLMWWMHRRVNFDQLPAGRTIVRFDVVDEAREVFWLVLEPAESSLCITDPGLPMHVHVTADHMALQRVFAGRITLADAFRDGTISIEGPRDMVRRFPTWFSWSPFYEATRRHLTGQQS